MAEEVEHKEDIPSDAKSANVQSREEVSIPYDENMQLSELHQTNPNSLREKWVATAVHFLQDPRVRNSSLAQKRAFIIKKGLTPHEADVAIERAGVGDLDKLSSVNNIPLSKSIVPTQPDSVYLSSPASVWSKWKSISSSFVVVGAACYAVYRLYKIYLEPWLFDKKQEDRINVEHHLAELSHSLSQLRSSVSSLESILTQQQEQICSILRTQVPAYRDENLDSVTLSEIKSEISSIKSLLLSRRQFPATPLSNPSIPTWQMQAQQQDEQQQEAAKSVNPDISTTHILDDSAQIAGGDSLSVENEVTSDGVVILPEDGH